jgi:hypothetical protein
MLEKQRKGIAVPMNLGVIEEAYGSCNMEPISDFLYLSLLGV